ncbi:MAG: hypothetical protein A2Y62_14465 [Candidatus Fischerbacteria bacterium RBG_13_37_8]|uniref:Uncharacterized protein n=1 Tax=Candidatus Fischerbacteria bacterium RBG_13_37_8 TaxID=1817863 RepID=A0A1F5VNN3_9BACT|nr:MAG: hypothetical protein A2Y62_14465 [Candidatus Fischerbacteria bacterium RBG_13_37_8]
MNNPDAKIRFRYFREVEYNVSRNADVFRVVVKEKPAPPPYDEGITVWTLDSTVPSENQWTSSPEISIGDWAGKEIWLFFEFDTVDAIDNYHIGIAIDNVELINAHWAGWSDNSGEVILNWIGGLPKYFVYRGVEPDFNANPPELRAYTPFNSKYENSLNDDQSYFYKVR